jgi:hypothetical protein
MGGIQMETLSYDPDRFFDALPFLGPVISFAFAEVALVLLTNRYRETMGPQRVGPLMNGMLLGVVGFSAWWVHYLLNQPRFTLQSAVVNIGLLSLMAGLNLAALLVDLGPTLSSRFSKTWVKALDFPYLIFGFGGIVRVVNGLPAVSDHVENLDTVGLLFLAGAISIRLAKVTLEVFFDRHISADYVHVAIEQEAFDSQRFKEFYATTSAAVAKLFSKPDKQ